MFVSRTHPWSPTLGTGMATARRRRSKGSGRVSAGLTQMFREAGVLAWRARIRFSTVYPVGRAWSGGPFSGWLRVSPAGADVLIVPDRRLAAGEPGCRRASAVTIRLVRGQCAASGAGPGGASRASAENRRGRRRLDSQRRPSWPARASICSQAVVAAHRRRRRPVVPARARAVNNGKCSGAPTWRPWNARLRKSSAPGRTRCHGEADAHPARCRSRRDGENPRVSVFAKTSSNRCGS